MQKILIVEDDPAISDIVAYNLEKEGYTVCCALDGETGLTMAQTENPDLILLDVMLPGMNGYDICQKVRQESSVPIIMLTARDSEDDRVKGLELGADDYIVKPFSMREMISRVKANLRRSSGELERMLSERAVHGFTFDTSKKEARLNGRRLDLSARELELLTFLAASPETVYSREELLSHVWGYEYYGGTRVVDVAIRRLREKLEEALPGGQKYIATKHGLGYYFDPRGGE